MTDISALKKGDKIVFSNGHESPVVNVMDADVLFLKKEERLASFSKEKLVEPRVLTMR